MSPGRLLLAATRIWLPIAIALRDRADRARPRSAPIRATSRSLEAGAGVALLIVALIVWMLNWMFRMSVESNRDREDEERAREYFDLHGYWPDEEQ